MIGVNGNKENKLSNCSVIVTIVRNSLLKLGTIIRGLKCPTLKKMLFGSLAIRYHLLWKWELVILCVRSTSKTKMELSPSKVFKGSKKNFSNWKHLPKKNFWNEIWMQKIKFLKTWLLEDCMLKKFKFDDHSFCIHLFFLLLFYIIFLSLTFNNSNAKII